MTARWFRRGTLGLVLACSVAHPALAAGSDGASSERAKVLFEAARGLVKVGDYAAACPKFEQSLSLNAGIGTEFNLADCLQHLGQTDRARGWFLDAAEKSHAAGQAEREQVARDRAAALAPEPVTREPAPAEAVVPAVVVVSAEPDARAKAELERRCVEAPTLVLRQEYVSLAEAAADLSALRHSAAALAQSAPHDARARKLERDLANVEAELADAWLLAGQVATRLARRAPATRESAARSTAAARVPLAAASSAVGSVAVRADAVASAPPHGAE